MTSVSQSFSNWLPLSQCCYLTISFSAVLFSFCLQSFPASGSFPMNLLFTSGGQSIGVSASVLLINIQDYFLKDWLVCLTCSPRDSQVFSPAPQLKSINSSVLSLLYGPIFTSLHDYLKNHSSDHTDHCRQSDVYFLIHYLYLLLFSFQGTNIFYFHGCSFHLQWF